MTLLVFSSCTKNEINYEPVVDPPFEKYKHFWTEIEKKEGAGNWVKLTEGNVLRLFTNDSIGIMHGQYEYNAINAKINIPESYLFAQDKDSLYFCRSTNSSSNPGKYTMDTLASIGYELINDSLMVIRNKSANANLEIKYSKQ